MVCRGVPELLIHKTKTILIQDATVALICRSFLVLPTCQISEILTVPTTSSAITCIVILSPFLQNKNYFHEAICPTKFDASALFSHTSVLTYSA